LSGPSCSISENGLIKFIFGRARLVLMTDLTEAAADQHLAWLARSFGRPDYLPLTANDLQVLSGVAEPVKRFRGSHLFRQGEPAVAAYLIREGEVDIYRNHSGSSRVVARVGPGSVIGDIAMFGEGVYKSSVRAVGHVRAYRFEREKLIPELAKHPAICLRWLVSGLNQLERTQSRIIRLMHKTVLAQVADLLAEEAGIRPDVSLSQASIATLLGVSRQSVNEALGELRSRGLVETGYRMITVLNADGLRALASEHGA
jgi:CRP/FNR family transcriptional regulator, cAMP and macrophage regulator